VLMLVLSIVLLGSLTDKRNKTKIMYIDLGAGCIATVWYEGLRRPVAFSGNELLYDWLHWSRRRIANMQSRSVRVDRVRRSRRSSKLYRIRKRRFEHAINTMVKTIPMIVY